jgi:hypothetical protein
VTNYDGRAPRPPAILVHAPVCGLIEQYNATTRTSVDGLEKTPVDHGLAAALQPA